MKSHLHTSMCLVLSVCLICSGCVEVPDDHVSTPFETTGVDACLSIVIDMSASFRESWDDRAYRLFLDISERFYTDAAMGGETKLVIGQLSGNEQVLLFEGRADDLRKQFNSPEAFNQFLKDRSDPVGSHVFEATRNAIEHIGAVSGVTEETRLLTVILSDMQDTHADPEAQSQMMDALRNYQSRGGALALYFVSETEAPKWKSMLNEAGFEPGHFVVENELSASPQLPQFD